MLQNPDEVVFTGPEGTPEIIRDAELGSEWVNFLHEPYDALPNDFDRINEQSLQGGEVYVSVNPSDLNQLFFYSPAQRTRRGFVMYSVHQIQPAISGATVSELLLPGQPVQNAQFALGIPNGEGEIEFDGVRRNPKLINGSELEQSAVRYYVNDVYLERLGVPRPVIAKTFFDAPLN